MPATAGGKWTYSTSGASEYSSLSALNSGLSATLSLAGILPLVAHSADFWLTQLMKFAASTLFWSGLVWRSCTNWWLLPQTPACEPICGTGADAPLDLVLGLRSLICQMPFQLNAFLLFLNAM